MNKLCIINAQNIIRLIMLWCEFSMLISSCTLCINYTNHLNSHHCISFSSSNPGFFNMFILKHTKSRTNSHLNLYFNTPTRLWNLLPATNIHVDSSLYAELKLKLTTLYLSYFLYNFDPNEPCPNLYFIL